MTIKPRAVMHVRITTDTKQVIADEEIDMSNFETLATKHALDANATGRPWKMVLSDPDHIVKTIVLHGGPSA